MTPQVKENPLSDGLGAGEEPAMSTEEPKLPYHHCGTTGRLDQGVACTFIGPKTPVAYAAVVMAQAGIRVFPVHVWYDAEAGKYRKRPLTKHGHHDRSKDEAQVLAWWRQHPDASTLARCRPIREWS